MKKFLLILAAAAALASCTVINDPSGETDFAKYMGMDKGSVKEHFGDVKDIMGMFTYNYKTGPVEMLTFMSDEDGLVTLISACMKENECPRAELIAHFEENYKAVATEEGTCYADNADITKASVKIEIGNEELGLYFVYYTNPNAESGEGVAIKMGVVECVETFLGASKSTVLGQYEDNFTEYNGTYQAPLDDENGEYVILTFTNDIASSVAVMAEDTEDGALKVLFINAGYVIGNNGLEKMVNNRAIVVTVSDGIVSAKFAE